MPVLQVRFDAIDTGFKTIETCFDTMETSVNTIKTRFNTGEPLIYSIEALVERAVTLGDGADVAADFLHQDLEPRSFLAAHDFMLAEASPTVNRLSRMMTRYRQARSKVACFFR
jgi:hypothetical protein